VGGEGGAGAEEGFCEAGPGGVGFYFGEDGCAEVDGGGVLAERAGHGDEDAVDLGLLFVEEADEFVVLLDGFEGFHEDGLSGGGGAVDDAGHLAFELDFYRDDEAVAADGDEVFLAGAAFAEAAEGSAEAVFDGAMLALHGAADAAKFGGGVVVEAAVGFDLAAEETQKRGEVVIEERGGEVGDAVFGGGVCGAGGDPGPGIRCTWSCGEKEVAPGGYALDYGEEVADAGGFEGGAFDAGVVEQGGGVEEAAELEAAAALEEGAEFGGALLLAVDPGAVGGGFEGEDPGAAEGRCGAGGDVVAEAGPFERGGAGLAEWGWDERQ